MSSRRNDLFLIWHRVTRHRPDTLFSMLSWKFNPMVHKHLKQTLTGRMYVFICPPEAELFLPPSIQSIEENANIVRFYKNPRLNLYVSYVSYQHFYKMSPITFCLHINELIILSGGCGLHGSQEKWLHQRGTTVQDGEHETTG